MNESYEKLLSDETDPNSPTSDVASERDEEATLFQTRSRRPSWQSIVVWCAGGIVFLAIYSLAVLKIADAIHPRSEHVISSPATEALRWKSKMLDARVKPINEYTGEPSEEIDAAWRDLVSMSNIKVPASVLKPLGRTSIPIPDEPDKVWVTLGVNHELHCLGRLRQSIYLDYYFPDYDEDDKRLNRLHSAHCIDYLRQTAMCRGDVSLTTYYWRDDNRLPVADFSSPHACVDWEKLWDWQSERLFDPMKPGWLKHPKLGVAFPDGNGTTLGLPKDGEF